MAEKSTKQTQIHGYQFEYHENPDKAKFLTKALDLLEGEIEAYGLDESRVVMGFKQIGGKMYAMTMCLSAVLDEERELFQA